MDFPSAEQVEKVNDKIAALVYEWARRLDALAMKYKIRGERWVKILSDPGRFGIGCEAIDGVRMWGAFYYPENGDPRAVENCRLTVKLNFLEAALILETQYLNEVKAFYERAEKIIASQEKKVLDGGQP